MTKPRLRIAPSPTGNLHIGTARAALFNWLLAQKFGGEFIVRIEDTDQTRSTQQFEADILDSLKWLGLNWQEGPDCGGPFGPYRQSERGPFYETAISKLLENNRAFWCFHDPEELAQERALNQLANQPALHRCSNRTLSRDQQNTKLKSGAQGVVRLRVESELLRFTDLVRGEIRVDTSTLGDFVIAKSSTEALYNLAVVVDDNAMAISHVLRGEDHISNTPKQLLIYRALELSAPEFGHLPLILAEDRSKMSKRHGATAVAEYRKLGYLPEALINFIALLGWNPGTEQEIFNPSNLTQLFSLERVRKSGSIFNKKRLDWLNGQHLRGLEQAEYTKRVLAVIDNMPYKLHKDGSGYRDAAGQTWQSGEVAAIIVSTQERVKTLLEAAETLGIYFAPPEYQAKLLVWKESTREKTLDALLAAAEIFKSKVGKKWSKEALELALNPLILKAGDRGTVLWPLRVALSGSTFSPGPFEMATLLGRQRSLGRLAKAVLLLKNDV